MINMHRFHLSLRWAIALPVLWLAQGIPCLAFEARTLEDMPYRLLKPKDYDATKTYPLVLFLHGAGEGGTDNGLQLKHVVKKFAEPAVMDSFPCFVVAPQSPPGVKWADTPWGLPSHTLPPEPTVSMTKALKICDAMIEEFSIDKTRIYVIGLSMGGYGTWDALMRRPDFFAAGVPICGGADDTKAALIKHIPVWVFHGAVDPTVPVIRSRNIVAALKAAGANPEPKYTEYPTVNHKSWGHAISTPELLPWLFEQQRTIKLERKASKDLPAANNRELRTWTSRKGTQINATLLRTESQGQRARLQTDEDKPITIGVKDLSDKDQAYIQSLFKQ